MSSFKGIVTQLTIISHFPVLLMIKEKSMIYSFTLVYELTFFEMIFLKMT